MTRKTLSIRADETVAPARPSADRLARLKDRARDLRRDPTEAETLLWEQLSGARLGGIKFTRKAVVGTAIVDFACPARWLVISLSQADGNPELDALQDRKLAETGIRVLRFSEAEITDDLDRVVKQVVAIVNEPFERPGRPQGRGRQG
jgi:very-short-patch-repair endonuclease